MNFFEEKLKAIQPLNKRTMKLAKERLDILIKPLESLGKLEDICIQMAGIYEDQYFDISKKLILAFGADHGVYEEGVSPCKQEITKLQFSNFAKGGNGVTSIAKFVGADVWPIDVGINCKEELKGVINRKIRMGTSNMKKGPAMTREEATKSLEVGIEQVKKAKDMGYNLIGIGEMGICNTTPSTAIMSVLCDFEPKDITGMGCGLDSEGIIRKTKVIEEAIELNNPNKDDAIDVLAKVGGFEIGAMAGVIIGGAIYKLPIVLDGFISYAAALIAYNLNSLTKEYMIASHLSAEPASKSILDKLNLSPLLSLDMKLGEGSGAALAFNVIEAANFTYKNMLTFDDSTMENTH
ncbi:nicotinate-nucleotide--dimethylbenzimidazole phosphoribosyltransferase [Lutibacter sp. B2]|nr:nicotinate-nucleotide--dimethylbenzimidazole phosphoribosyltransferase [Lutibacter sp. B2]